MQKPKYSQEVSSYRFASATWRNRQGFSNSRVHVFEQFPSAQCLLMSQIQWCVGSLLSIVLFGNMFFFHLSRGCFFVRESAPKRQNHREALGRLLRHSSDYGALYLGRWWRVEGFVGFVVTVDDGELQFSKWYGKLKTTNLRVHWVLSKEPIS